MATSKAFQEFLSERSQPAVKKKRSPAHLTSALSATPTQ